MNHVIAYLLLFAAGPLLSQTPVSLRPAYLAVDAARSLVLAHVDDRTLAAARYGVVTPTDTFTLLTPPAALRYDRSYAVRNGVGDTLELHFTPLPLIQLASEYPIEDDDKVLGRLTYADGADEIVSTIGVEYRGGFSLRYPKKNLDLEFRDEADPEKSADVRFAGMRDDDDWVLDALYNEPSRLNAYMGHKVWLDLHRPTYADAEPEAKAGADLAYVEVFLNGAYSGLYTLGEQVDRKQLKLKKNKDANIRGELYKSEKYTAATSFTRVPAGSPRDDDWAGWEMKHPDVADGDWALLQEIVRFAGESSPDDFDTRVSERFDLVNVVDFLLFVNAMLLTDNVSKNTYLARYDGESPYFFVPWDMDAGLGNAYEGSRYPHTDAWFANNLFRRLTDRSPANFNILLCARYEELRTGVLHTDSLVTRLNSVMDRLESSGAYAREAARWPGTVDYGREQREYTTGIIRSRMDFLDAYVCNITTPTRGDKLVSEGSLRVYPNPAGSWVRVVRPAPAREERYALYDLRGRLARAGLLRGRGQRVDVAGLPGGMYVLRVGARQVRLVLR